MIGKYLEEIIFRVTELDSLLQRCSAAMLEDPYKPDDELDTGMTIQKYIDLMPEMQNEMNVLLKRYENRLDNYSVERNRTPYVPEFKKIDLVNYQTELLFVLRQNFGNIFHLGNLDFLIRLLDVAFFPRGVNIFFSQCTVSKSFVVGIIALSIKKWIDGKIILRKNKICVVQEEWNFLVDVESQITCKKHQNGEVAIWLYNVQRYLLEYARHGILIPKSFKGIEFI